MCYTFLVNDANLYVENSLFFCFPEALSATEAIAFSHIMARNYVKTSPMH